jgi:two-component system probable response regulator PhcQ
MDTRRIRLADRAATTFGGVRMSTDNAGVPAAVNDGGPPTVVLYVDDEEQALKYFKKAFGRRFPVLTAPCVDAALAILEAEHGRIGVLLTDQRMPGKTGVELLTRVRQTWPHIVRILVTAYSDMESAVAAVNAGAVYKYLTKPVDLAQTQQVLADAMGMFHAERQRDTVVREKVGRLERMIAADRVRSLSVMATGVSHHLRNSLTAITCFFEEMRASKGDAAHGLPSAAPPASASAPASATAGADGDGEYLDQLLDLANEERERLVQIVKDVESRGRRFDFRFDQQVGVRELVDRAVAAAAAAGPGAAEVACDVPAGLPALKVDAAAVVRMLGILIGHARRHSPPGTRVRVAADGPAKYWNGSGVRLLVTGGGPAWKESDVASFFMPFAVTTQAPGDVGLELLDAFQIAMGHQGDVVAHPAPPAGPGFEVWLPLDPSAVTQPAVVDGRFELTPVH